MRSTPRWRPSLAMGRSELGTRCVPSEPTRYCRLFQRSILRGTAPMGGPSSPSRHGASLSAKSADAELPELLVVVGPTASGKTELAIRFAELADGEIVSADSVQIYRYFDIGSGKPTLVERRGVPHHLIDAADPSDELDASVFAQRAAVQIEQIAARGRLPIVCGGTFLWVRA